MHRRREFDEHLSGPVRQCLDVDRIADGEHRRRGRRGREGRGEHHGVEFIGEPVEFVDGADGDGVGELRCDTGQFGPAEAIAVALDDGNESVDAVDDLRHVAAPHRAADGQPDRHRPDGSSASRPCRDCVSARTQDDRRSRKPRIRFVPTRHDQFPTVLIGFVGDNLGAVNLRRLFEFPDPVNETSARFVAAGVVVMAAVFVTSCDGWVLVPLTYGFLARVATGPRLSPLGQFATRFATPRLEARRGARLHSLSGARSAEALRPGHRPRLHDAGVARPGCSMPRRSARC